MKALSYKKIMGLVRQMDFSSTTLIEEKEPNGFATPIVHVAEYNQVSPFATRS
jgi:hypothetical protein